MAYDTSNPPVLQTQGGLDGALPRRWSYSSTNLSTAIVDTTGYFSDGYQRGMRVNDLIEITQSDGTTITVVTHRVKTASSSGPVTVGGGTTIGAA